MIANIIHGIVRFPEGARVQGHPANRRRSSPGLRPMSQQEAVPTSGLRGVRGLLPAGAQLHGPGGVRVPGVQWAGGRGAGQRPLEVRVPGRPRPQARALGGRGVGAQVQVQQGVPGQGGDSRPS